MKAQLPEDSRTSTKLLLGRHALETVSSRTLLKRTFKAARVGACFTSHQPRHMGSKLYLVQNATGGSKICQDEEAETKKMKYKIGFIARHQKSISRIPNKMDEQIIH